MQHESAYDKQTTTLNFGKEAGSELDSNNEKHNHTSAIQALARRRRQVYLDAKNPESTAKPHHLEDLSTSFVEERLKLSRRNLTESKSKINLSEAQKISTSTIAVKESSKCPVAWSSMSGSDQVRWCDACQHFVYNQQALSTQELLALVLFHEGVRPTCLYKRQDNMIMSAECQLGRMRAARKRVSIAGMLALWLISCIALAAFSHSSRAPEPEKVLQSGIKRVAASDSPKLETSKEIAPAANANEDAASEDVIVETDAQWDDKASESPKGEVASDAVYANSLSQSTDSEIQPELAQ